MAFLFYILAWLSILGGAAYAGYLVVNATRGADRHRCLDRLCAQPGPAGDHAGAAGDPGRALLLAIAGILSRLDEIAYNTRPLN